MTDEDLNRIQADADAAPAGPWEAYFSAHGDPFVVPAAMPYLSSQIAQIAVAPDDYGRAAAKFCASARTNVPVLVAEVKKLRSGAAAAAAMAEVLRFQVEHYPCPAIHTGLYNNGGRCGEDSDDPGEWCISAKARKALAAYDTLRGSQP